MSWNKVENPHPIPNICCSFQQVLYRTDSLQKQQIFKDASAPRQFSVPQSPCRTSSSFVNLERLRPQLVRIPPNSFSQAWRRIGPVPLRPPFVASSYLFFKQSLPLIFSLNNLSLSPTGCPTHSSNEVSPAPPSPSSSAPYQTHSQNCLLIVQLDNCHLSLLLLSVSHKELNGFGRRGGVQHEEGLWPCKVTRRVRACSLLATIGLNWIIVA